MGPKGLKDWTAHCYRPQAVMSDSVLCMGNQNVVRSDKAVALEKKVIHRLPPNMVAHIRKYM